MSRRLDFTVHRVSRKLGRHDLILETGKLARQANGAVLVKYGATAVLVTACMSLEKREGIDFFPLMVEYREKQYAAGKIPGGFFKREGKPTEKEVLSSRLIDRPIRPLFPKDLVNEVQVVAQVLSSDPDYDPDVFAIIGASAALTISNIPFNGPIAAVRIGKLEDGLILFPTYDEQENGVLDLCITGKVGKIIMIESGSREISEEDMASAMHYAEGFFKDIIDMQEELRRLAGKEKISYEPFALPEGLIEEVENRFLPDLEDITRIPEKEVRIEKFNLLVDKAVEELVSSQEEALYTDIDVKRALSEVEKKLVRLAILRDRRRVDGRALDEIRPIACEVSVLPRTHGSSLFTRGQTQSLCITTLGTKSDEQMIEGLEEESYKNFMLHYSFPPFSVGEVKPIRGPGRREIGHGALAERAIRYVMPSKEEFPYTVRVVSEILESNGSSSMATACAASLSLMDAGVPIAKPVAGIAIGLVKESDTDYVLLTDIAGLEDHYGDMDFKVAGTKDGITAIQMDLKVDGITLEMVKEALSLAKKAREEVLEVMNSVLDKPRPQISPYAPRVTVVEIPEDKIRDLIGPMGKNIKRIIAETESSIDIDPSGQVTVSAPNTETLNRTLEMIEIFTSEPEVGKIYDVKITRIVNFGAFCELPSGKEGLIHISEIADSFVSNVEDYLKVGDRLKAKLIKIDELGRLNFSLKQAKQE